MMLGKLLVLLGLVATPAFTLNCPTMPVNNGWLAYATNGSVANSRDFPPGTHLKLNCFNAAPVVGFYQAICAKDGDWYPELGTCGEDTVCGTRPYFPRIFGGTLAKLGEYPWMASLRIEEQRGYSGCGATIINNIWLMTAAHCVFNPAISRIEATMGTVNIASGSDQSNVVKVTASHYITHPDYNDNDSTWNFLDNDYALLKLSRPLNYTDFVRPICLPVGLCDANSDSTTASNEYDSCRNGRDELASAGWGYNSTMRIAPPDLYKINVTLRQRSFCYGNVLDNQHSKICSSGAAIGQSICQGDSGGPLVCFKNGRAYQIGITSGVWSCGGLKQIFARVCYAMTWFQQVLSGSIPLRPLRSVSSG